MNISKIIDKVYVVQPEQKYYFVRTDSGNNFEEFYDKGYIGIGWNYITSTDVEKLTNKKLDTKIRKAIVSNPAEKEAEEEELKSGSGKGKITKIRNKLKRFGDLKRGDLIIIPSRSSSRFAFGIIDDEKLYTETNKLQLEHCNYYKRRKVKWLKVESFHNLDPIFYKIKTSRPAIVNISQYGDYIDFVINTLYIKDNSGYLVFNIKTNDEINVSSLLGLIESIQTLTNHLNEEFQLGENVDNNTIRINVQSPGKVAFKTGVQIAVILAATLTLHSCSPSDVNLQNEDKEKILNVTSEYKSVLDSLDRSMQELRIDAKQMNTFK